MRPPLLLTFLLVICGCAERPEVQLPRLGTVGDRPSGELLEIVVRADGVVFAEGRAHDARAW